MTDSSGDIVTHEIVNGQLMIFMTYQGVKQPLSYWTKQFGLSRATLYRRALDGMQTMDVLRPPRYITQGTLCWDCKHAVPSATTGCSWSRSFRPVPGWTASQTEPNSDRAASYFVERCPEFVKG